MSTDYTPRRGDIVKLGRTAKETHEVLGTTTFYSIQVRQRSTGKTRFVRVDRCILVYRSAE